MTFGPAFILAFAAACLATLAWWLIEGAPRDRARSVFAIFVFGLLLALVIAAGPLVRLP